MTGHLWYTTFFEARFLALGSAHAFSTLADSAPPTSDGGDAAA